MIPAFSLISRSIRRPMLRPAAALGLLLAACGPGGNGTGSAPAPGSGESLPTILAHADASFRDGDYLEAQKTYETAVRLDPETSRPTCNLATCYLKNRQVKKSLDLLTSYLARHADDDTARLVLARTYMRLGDLDAASEALRRVVRSHPEAVVARYNLGLAAYRGRRYDEAETNLKAACELKPDLPDAFYTLGLTYLALGRTADAIASLEKAVAVDPHHVGARFNLANAYARAGRMRDAERAQAVYADLSGRSKSDKEKETQIAASSVQAFQYFLEKKYPEALAAYRDLAQRYPDHAPLYNQIGQILIRLDRRDEAFEALRRAIELDPKLSDAHYLISGLYRERGDTAAADRELTTFAALETIPEGKSGY